MSDRKAPTSLKLEFSKAADYNRVYQFFDPKLKDEIDTANYITTRIEDDLRKAINNGCATFLSNDKGDAMTLVIDYQIHMKDNPAKGERHDYTELATVMSRVDMRGFQSATLVVAATALKEWWAHPPKTALMTSIEHDNIPPQRMSKALSWSPVKDPAVIEDLLEAVYKSAVEDIPTEQEERDKIDFFICGDQAIMTQAKVLLHYMDLGKITNPKTGHAISLDLSALDRVGLTKLRLEAIANGNLSRDSLKKIKPPAP